MASASPNTKPINAGLDELLIKHTRTVHNDAVDAAAEIAALFGASGEVVRQVLSLKVTELS